MIVLLTVHHSRIADLDAPDRIATWPSVPLTSYRDGFGNWCVRMTAPAGLFTIGTDGVIADECAPDPVSPGAMQHAVEDLPPEMLTYLLPSRFCESDLIADTAWALFSGTAPGWPRVQAISDYVHNWVSFGYAHSRPTRTAVETFTERCGVCRDFAHLAIAFCRAMNIPARYCTGYISDVGVPPPHAPMDFAAWIEVFLGGEWRVFDPRNNMPMRGRILIAQGRDAADVPLTHSFGKSELTDFRVWIAPADIA